SQRLSAGTYRIAPGVEVVVSAVPDQGYRFPSGASGETWTVVAKKNPTCVQGVKLVHSGTSITEVVTRTPAATSAPAASQLPFTGAPTGILALLGLVSVTVGGVLTLVGSRRFGLRV